MAQTNNAFALRGLSEELAGIVENVSASVVRVEDGSRLTATGVIWTDDGTVVTTSHGVERDDGIAIELIDGTSLPAVLVGRDADTDIAVLKVESSALSPIARPEGDGARIGSLVLALARPGRAGLQATLGIVSARTETQTGGRSEYLLHTDADMYPGFSGGPLLDMEGNILGLINLMFGRGRGIAIGTPIVANIARALLTNGCVQRGYIGVRTQQVALPDELRAILQWTQDRALLVAQVETGSPADDAGLLLGDPILRFNDSVIHDVDALRSRLRAHPPGSEVTLDYLRGGELRQVSVALGLE